MEFAKRLSVGALMLIIGAFAVWLVLACVGWIGQEVILYFGGSISDWEFSTPFGPLFGTGIGALGARLFVFFVVFFGIIVCPIMIIGLIIVNAMHSIGAFFLDAPKSQKQPD